MKKFFLVPLMGLIACQSSRDPESHTDIGLSHPGYTSDSLLSFEELSQLSSQCEATVASLYGQRAQVAAVRQREFSIAVGQALEACNKLQQAMAAVRHTSRDREDYKQNLAFAKECIRSREGADSADTHEPFPEATETLDTPLAVPNSSIHTEPLASTSTPPLGS